MDSDKGGEAVLACWHCYQSSLATDWVAYTKKNRKYIAHSSGGCEVQGQGAGVVAFW